jgi:hypothetical protein
MPTWSGPIRVQDAGQCSQSAAGGDNTNGDSEKPDKHAGNLQKRSPVKRVVAAVMLAVCLLVVRATAADTAPAARGSQYWFTLGLGGTFALGVQASGLVTPTLGFSYELRPVTLTGRLAVSEEDLGSELADIGILCGIRSHGQKLQTSVGAGIGYVTGENANTSKTIAGFGIPVEAQLTWPVGSFAGFWVGAYGNINTSFPVVGLMLGLKFGKLR